MSRPTRPRWADGDPSFIIEPGSGKKDVGWLLSEKPPFQYMNWIHKTTDDYLGFLDDKSENLVTTFLRSTGSATWNSGTNTLTLSQDLEIVFRIPDGEQINVLEAGSYTLSDGNNLLFRKDRTNTSPVTLVLAGSYATLDDGQYFTVNNSAFSDTGFEFEEIVFRRDGTRIEIPLLGTSYENGDTFYFSDAIASEIATRTSEVLELNQKTTSGQNFANLGLTYDAGVLTICAADGSALSSTNKGFVFIDYGTPGSNVKNLTVEITANVTITDGSNATKNILGNFGHTASMSIGNPRPFFIGYALKDDSPLEGGFFIGMNPCQTYTPSNSNNIGKAGTAPATSSQNSILFFDAGITTSQWTLLPCVMLGGIRMEKSATDSNGWTVSSLTNGLDGFGQFYDACLFVMNTGQGSCVSGKYTDSSMDFSTSNFFYNIKKSGFCDFFLNLNGDGGTDGSGGYNLLLALPYVPYANIDFEINGSFLLAGNSKASVTILTQRSGNQMSEFSYQSTIGTGLNTWLHSDFGSGTRLIRGSGTFKAFNSF